MRGQRRRDLTNEQVFAAVEAEKAVNPNGAVSRAAKALGVHPSAIRTRIKTATERGMLGAAPSGQYIKATSTLFDADGKPKLQWVKSAEKKADPDEWARIVKDVFADTAPVKAIPAPKQSSKDLLAVYPIGDHHTAMYAWGEETGDDYDLKIAERLLVSAATHLVDTAPVCENALIVNVGDYFHVDNIHNETSRSHHSLDVDTRYAAMIRAGVRMLRTCIDKALEKHRAVTVVNACGNHDDLGSLWLSLALSLLYEKNPRVTIHTGPGKFYYHAHGKVLLGVTHGDTVKLEQLGGVMASDRPAEWGATKHRYWLTGHIHQRKVLELPGVMVESFRTLAARDAWASAAGYRSGRDMTCIAFHREHGEVSRQRFDIGMLK